MKKINLGRSSFKNVFLIYVMVIFFLNSGCTFIADYQGEQVGKNLRILCLSIEIDLVTLPLFENQPNKDNTDNQSKAYRVILKMDEDPEVIKELFVYFTEIKTVNFDYYKDNNRFYCLYENLYEQLKKREDGEDFKTDPWGNEYYYRVISRDTYIIGTMGRNGKWNVKLDEKLPDKLVFGTLNCFKDDIFIKIKYPS